VFGITLDMSESSVTQRDFTEARDESITKLVLFIAFVYVIDFSH
jgi:hypothetical protein